MLTITPCRPPCNKIFKTSSKLLNFFTYLLILVQRPHQDFTCVTMLRQRTRSMADCLQFLERPTLPRSCSTWSNHLALCAPLRLVPAGFETNTIFAGLLSGILTTCPCLLY